MTARCAVLALALVAGCSGGMEEVADPFYVGPFEAGGEAWLFRCIDGPGRGCANDTLPDGRVLSAGGNARFIAFELDDGFYYFRRIAQERRGWGQNPEVIIGPMAEARFATLSQGLGLPELEVVKP